MSTSEVVATLFQYQYEALRARGGGQETIVLAL